MFGRLSARRTGCAKERSSGSVRGAISNGRPYRDRQSVLGAKDLGLVGLPTDYTFRVNFVTLIGDCLLYCSV